MFALREFPPNPYLVVYHVRSELTQAVVRGYARGKAHTAPPLVVEILGIPGVQGVQFFRYELWVRRAPDAAWQGLIPPIEAAFRQHLGGGEVHEFIGDQRYMTCCLSHVDVPKRPVFEGVESAASHPLARELFAIEGVAEVFLTPGQVRIRKGAAFRWEEIQPGIQVVLKRFKERNSADTPS